MVHESDKVVRIFVASFTQLFNSADLDVKVAITQENRVKDTIFRYLTSQTIYAKDVGLKESLSV